MATKMDPLLSDPLHGDGPGAYLRKAREDAEMSVDKVATALLLHSATVEAIEADAYERLPAPTFVRGYLRGYARVLGLPAGPVLEIFDRQGFEPPPLSTDITESTQAHTSDTAVRLVTYAVAVVLVLLVGLWWHSQEDGGFGIAGDLFDRSSESDQNPSTLTARESGTALDDGEAGSESVGMVSDSADDLPRGAGFPFSSTAEDAETDDRTPDERAVAEIETAQESGAAQDDEASTAVPPAQDPTPRDVAAAAVSEFTGAGTEVDSAITPPVQADTSRENETAEDEPGVTATSAPDTSEGGEDSAVTAPVTETPPGEIVEIAPAPTGSEAEGESVTTAPPQPRATPGDDGSGETEPAEGTASDDIAETGSAPGESPVSETTAAREASAPQDAPPEIAGGVDPTTTGADPAPGPASAQSGLVLEFVHESWVEVYDGERTRLFFGLVQPGRVLDFDGSQPFDVLLGYGKDVRVSVDGKPFDYTPFLKHGVARFSIGADSADGDDAAEIAAAPVPNAGDTSATEPEVEDHGE